MHKETEEGILAYCLVASYFMNAMRIAPILPPVLPPAPEVTGE